MAPTNIALVTCSTREPRLNPSITEYVHSILAEEIARTNWPGKISIVDLAAQHLPLYNEPAIPSHLPSQDPTPHYTHAHTRAWSALVKEYDAFIFVTPQYNWSIPASLKNAIDYLFHEWTGKPAGIVTYGGRGGGKAGEHLVGILNGLRMAVAQTRVGIVVRREVMEGWVGSAGGVGEEDREGWRGAGVKEGIRGVFGELVKG
ncbi:flavoprotein-like protein [Aspergillus pseudoustus]|uniref:Flavoprotein-like protein n=1 Tax=Aspergillus pseudoustus TaxID=1810923 RepID=A0ABR4IT71_9EURO